MTDPLVREHPTTASRPEAASRGRALLATMPFLLLAADPVLVAACLGRLDARGVLMAVGLPAMSAFAFDWPAALRARHPGRVLFSFALAVAASLAILSGIADLAGAPPVPDARLCGAASGLILVRSGLCIACRRRAGARGWARERIAILGSAPAARLLQHRLTRPGASLLALAGRFEATPNGIDALLRLARAEPLDRVLLALPAQTEPLRLDAVLRQLKTIDVRVERCAIELLAHGSASALDPFDAIPTVLLAGRPIPSHGLACKAAADKLLSLLLLVCVAPVLLVVAVAIRLDSPGPVLFRQLREGRNGADFEILKFRTMTWRAPDQRRVVQTTRGDVRVTRVGRVLRATSLDELPQLLNVLRGDMSLVGPRPHPHSMTTDDRLSVEIDADYPQRHRVKPGMTGWAQVNGSRGGLRSPEELCQRLRYDLHYIENWSLLLDLKIALLTPFKMIFHNGAAF